MFEILEIAGSKAGQWWNSGDQALEWWNHGSSQLYQHNDGYISALKYKPNFTHARKENTSGDSSIYARSFAPKHSKNKL